MKHLKEFVSFLIGLAGVWLGLYGVALVLSVVLAKVTPFALEVEAATNTLFFVVVAFLMTSQYLERKESEARTESEIEKKMAVLQKLENTQKFIGIFASQAVIQGVLEVLKLGYLEALKSNDEPPLRRWGAIHLKSLADSDERLREFRAAHQSIQTAYNEASWAHSLAKEHGFEVGTVQSYLGLPETEA